MTILFFFLSPLIFGQTNLVQNPSFEIYDTCPNNIGQIYLAIGWFNSGTSTVDYFNQCSSNWGVPGSTAGYQNAATGVGYGGFYAYWWPNPKGLEYFGCLLEDSLIINQKYFISFKLNRADFSNCAVDKIGTLFTKEPYIYNDLTYNTKNYCQFSYNNFVIDTTNWINVYGSFIADSSYKYLYIGNFFCDSLTNKIILDNSNHCGSYYLIDDICVSTDSLTCLTVSINEINITNSINIFPNPTKNKLTIDLTSTDKYYIDMFDLFGAKILSARLDSYSKTLDLQNVVSGIYYITLVDDKGQKLKTEKLIIIK
jgi:hypothetical protein